MHARLLLKSRRDSTAVTVPCNSGWLILEGAVISGFGDVVVSGLEGRDEVDRINFNVNDKLNKLCLLVKKETLYYEGTSLVREIINFVYSFGTSVRSPVGANG